MPKDLRFNFKRNPYSATQYEITSAQKTKQDLLNKYISNNAKKFIAVNPITNIRYVQLSAPNSLQVLNGIKNPCTHTDMDDFSYIANNIKKFILSTNMELIPELEEWVGNTVEENQALNDNDNVEVTALDNTLVDVSPPSYESKYNIPATIIDNLPQTSLSSISIGVNYDSTTDKRLDYNEVCALCMNIARLNNNNKNIKDPSIVAIENQRKRALINEIARYRKNKIIATVCSDADVTKLSIEQLETNLAQCKEKHNSLKLKDVSRNGLQILGDAYDAIFPLGIPIGKGRHLQFNGVGDEIIKELHNPTTAVGLSYDNFISKHNIHISDELSIVAAIGTILLKNIHITKKTDNNDATEEDVEETIEEEEEEDEEEDLKDVE